MLWRMVGWNGKIRCNKKLFKLLYRASEEIPCKQTKNRTTGIIVLLKLVMERAI